MVIMCLTDPYVWMKHNLHSLLVDNQLDAQFFYNTFIYLNPLHVSSTFVLILRRTTVWIHLLV